MTTDTPREPVTEAMERLGREAFLEWADVIGLSDSQINTDWSPFMAGFRARAAGLREIAEAMDFLNAAIDDTHPEGDGCDICNAADEMDRLLAAPEAEE